MIWQAGRFALDLAEPRVMGIVNVTPDSFSDGDPTLTPARAIATCERLLKEGAHVLDLGGESSRPGAEPVSVEIELTRLPAGSARGADPRLPGLGRHQQARGHARRPRSRRRHRQ
jgi:hypothetical protein